MTDEDLTKIDAEIAEKIMGWPSLKLGQMRPLAGYWNRHTHIDVRMKRANGDWMGETWRPTRDIAAAFQVVEKMRERGLHLILNDTMSAFRARFFDADWSIDQWVRAPDPKLTAWEETIPFAISRAALKSIREVVKK